MITKNLVQLSAFIIEKLSIWVQLMGVILFTSNSIISSNSYSRNTSSNNLWISSSNWFYCYFCWVSYDWDWLKLIFIFRYCLTCEHPFLAGLEDCNDSQQICSRYKQCTKTKYSSKTCCYRREFSFFFYKEPFDNRLFFKW